MKDLWMNPVVLGASGVIAVGFVLLILALRALGKGSAPKPVKEFDFPARASEPLSVLGLDSNPFSTNPIMPPTVPVANKDVLDKVDLISQRLVDMQMLLNKQVSTPSGAAHGLGQSAGLSPDMLDKLLKITSTVAQQIDVLQKALGGAGTAPVASAPPAVPMTAPGALPRTTPLMTPVSQVVGSSAPLPPPANP